MRIIDEDGLRMRLSGLVDLKGKQIQLDLEIKARKGPDESSASIADVYISNQAWGEFEDGLKNAFGQLMRGIINQHMIKNETREDD